MSKTTMHHSQPVQRGITLTEVVVSTLLVGTVVAGALSTLGASVQTQTIASELVNGPLLADALLAEIMSMPYEDPEDGGVTNGLNSGESSSNRNTFDDVDDYDNWNSATVQDRGGNALSGYSGWSRSVTVTWADRMSGNAWSLYDTGLKRIIVIVTAPDGAVTTRSGFRSRDGSLEQAPTVDKTVVTELEANLQVGSASIVRRVTNLLNHVEDPNGS